MTVAKPRLSESLGRFLEKRAAARPASLVWGEETIGLATLLEESRRVARGLAPAWLALYLACARLGAVAVAVNTRFRSAEIADIVGRSGARLLALWPDFRIIVYGGADPPDGRVHGKPAIAYDALSKRPAFERDLGDGPVGSVIFTTSGTTSAPKFVLHDHYSVISHAGAVAHSFGYDQPGAVLLQALPMCGVFGFCQAMAALAGGAVTIMPPAFEAEAAALLIDRHAVTALNGSDEMFARLLAVRSAAMPFRSLRACHFAAFSPTMAGIAAEAEQRGLGPSGLYGSSEAQAFFSRQRPEAPVEARARPGGFPVGEAYWVRVCDPEGGGLLRPGHSGEIELSGPSLVAGYVGDDEATGRAFTDDGWFRSGCARWLSACWRGRGP
jgi:fatty-acyl-CoA synthase